MATTVPNGNNCLRKGKLLYGVTCKLNINLSRIFLYMILKFKFDKPATIPNDVELSVTCNFIFYPNFIKVKILPLTKFISCFRNYQPQEMSSKIWT